MGLLKNTSKGEEKCTEDYRFRKVIAKPVYIAVRQPMPKNFDVLLTVQLSIILVINQLNAQIFVL